VIPYFIIRQLKSKNTKFIVRKVSAVVQEICEYMNGSPFKDAELNKEQLTIFTSKKDLKNYRFVGLISINVFNKISFPKIKFVVAEQLMKLTTDAAFELLRKEKNR